jgi:hypothetical protein
MSTTSGACAEISGTAKAVRSVADAARIAASEGASALIRSLRAQAGLAAADARADKLIGANAASLRSAGVVGLRVLTVRALVEIAGIDIQVVGILPITCVVRFALVGRRVEVVA